MNINGMNINGMNFIFKQDNVKDNKNSGFCKLVLFKVFIIKIL